MTRSRGRKNRPRPIMSEPTRVPKQVWISWTDTVDGPMSDWVLWDRPSLANARKNDPHAEFLEYRIAKRRSHLAARAVRAHDALVEALQDVVDQLIAFAPDDNDEARSAIRCARAALKLVEG